MPILRTDPFLSASSAESVGNRGLRKTAKIVIESYFHGVVGSESVGTSGEDSNLIVESLYGRAGDLSFCLEPIEEEVLVCSPHPCDFLQGLQSTAHRSGAPSV